MAPVGVSAPPGPDGWKEPNVTQDTSAERWLPVVGYTGFYEVSDFGRVRSRDRVVRSRDGRSHLRRGVVLSPRQDPRTGRLSVTLHAHGEQETCSVHRLVLRAFVGPPPAGHEGCHDPDRDPSNCRLTNLRWDTRSANALDSVRHGTHNMVTRAACPLDHRLELPNLVAHKLALGKRGCLACARALANVHHAKRRHGLVLDFKATADAHYARIMAGL